jgi:predicted AlkP superfamily pyrophosphatase or phosphodiesterase
MVCRKLHHFGQLIALALAVLAISAASQAADIPQGVMLIGWDGAQRNHVKEMMAQNELPNLEALAKDGTMVDIDVVSGVTDTAAGWSQILTGYISDKTGVYSDKIYQPIPEGYTIFERLEDFFGPENIQTAAIISKTNYYLGSRSPFKIPYVTWREEQEDQKKIDNSKPGPDDLQGGKIVEENGEKFVQIQGGPYRHVKDHADLFVNGLGENEKVGLRAIDQLEKCGDKRFFFFIHFGQVDKAGHKYGENSQEYSDGLKLDDLWTGKIIDKLKELGIYDKTLVYVTADHGFDEGKKSHTYAPYIFLATNDKKVDRSGTREDIAPTVLKRFGLDMSKIEPRLDGIPLDETAPERKAPAENPNPPKRPAVKEKTKAPAM